MSIANKVLSYSFVKTTIFNVFMVAAAVAGQARAACDAERHGGPPNHFIVLLDGSGSMQIDYGQTWWKPGFNKLSPIEKSARIDRVVRKALEAAPEGFPCFSAEDRFSFAFFSLDWANPSYKLENLFIVPEGLLLRTGEPDKESYWPGLWSPREPFSGHSPIVHATTAIFPYLGGQIANAAAQGPVGQTILVRISDGSYNTLGGMVDEDKAIQRIAEFNRKKKAGLPTDHGVYDSQTESARNGLDVGFRNQTCALVLASDKKTSDKISCGEDAKASLENWSDPNRKGEGLLVTYLEAQPRAQALETLAALPNTTLTLRREARGGVVYWQDEAAQAALLGWASADGALQAEPQQPVGFYVKTPGGADSKLADCKLTQAATDKLAQAGVYKRQAIDCGGGRSLPALDAATAAQYQRGGVIDAYYRTVYRVRFQGTPPAYPLEWEQSRDIPLQLTVAPGRDEQYHPSLWPGVASPKLEAVSDPELLKAAGGGTLKASDLAEKKTGNPEDNARNIALEGFGAVVLVGLVWVFWPPRRRQGWHLALPDGTVPRTVDFNRKHDSLGEQIGQIVLERTPPALPGLGRMWHSTRLSLAIPNPEVHFQGPSHEDTLNWNPGMLGVVEAGKPDHEDRRANQGNRYPLLFDASQIADFETEADGPVDGTLKFYLQSSFPVERTLALNLNLVPERAKFHFEEELWLARKPDSAGQPVLSAHYGKGHLLPLVGYVLENRVAHAFSEPAQGLWLLSPRALDGKALAAGAFYLVDMDEPADSRVKQSAIDYALRKDAKKKLGLVADLKALGNPLPNEIRQYEIKLIDQDGITVAEHRFALERSDQRTFIQMALLDHARNTVQEYDELRPPPSDSLPFVDLSGTVQNISEDVTGRRVLFGLKLANRCEEGAGHVDWRVLLDDPAGGGNLTGEGVECRLDAFEVDDQAEGTLYDDSDKARRETVLTVALDPSGPQFDQRESWLDLPLCVVFDKYEDGEKGNKQTLSWKTTVRLALRHVPPRRVLAIDFGTSAIAVAYTADEEPQFLPLAGQVVKKLSTLSQHLEDNNPALLSADANLAGSQNLPLRPNIPNYLDLPAIADKVVKDVGTAIPSLKMLLVRNYRYLPINPGHYPYTDEQGNIENRVNHRPLLDEVLLGVFEKLRDDYIKPSFAGLLPYTYLVATHPNTYTTVERSRFEEILKTVFVGQSPYHQLYAENVHLLGESDAVLNYYLLHAARYQKAQGRELAGEETVFIWDIGAGTLDMTLATIQREALTGGGWEIKKISIHDRHGVEAAGNRLTECIVRDLDQYLYENIGDAYILPLVKRDDRPFPRVPQDKTSESLFKAMHPLRLQIEKYKRVLVSGNTDTKIQLYGSAYDSLEGEGGSLISLSKEHYDVYRTLADLEVTTKKSISWQPSIEAPFVSAFVKRVAESEVKSFVDNVIDARGEPIRRIDTVIVSGRTSLWPKLLDRLKGSLPDVGTWIQLQDINNPKHDPSKMLKNAVAAGAVIGQTRWQASIERDAPAIFGRYAICYERDSKEDWRYVDLPDNKTQDLNMPNASICKIGIRHAGRFKVAFEFSLRWVAATGNSKLKITMSTNSADQKGSFRCHIENTDGHALKVDERIAATMKPHRPITVWPLTSFQLEFLTPDEIASVETEL